MTIPLQLGLVLVILVVGMLYSWRAKKLTVAGAWTGGLVGLLVYMGAGVTGLGLLCLFFGLGTAASAWQVAEKRRLGLAEANKGCRTAGQVLANAGVAGLLGFWAWQSPAHAPLAGVLLAGSLTAATADTLSSELGNLYGRRFYHVLTGRPDVRGENGVVSLEGTLLGLLGSALVAAVYCACEGWGPAFGWLLLAGTVGNLVDSILGATLERRGCVGNNVVNFGNTLVGASTVAILTAFI